VQWFFLFIQKNLVVPVMTLLGRRLQAARKEQNITQKVMADFLKISEQGYQLYEYGKRAPSNENLVKICHRLKVSSDWLLGISDDPAIRNPTLTSEEAAALEREAI
jgi:transcriptional regulator with XRE-family HTH domain